MTTSIAGSGYSGVLVTNVSYSVIYVFASCSEIALRWQSDSMSANAIKVTVAVGTSVSYEGNDYISVDLSTRLIYNVTSSSDLLNYYIALGDDDVIS